MTAKAYDQKREEVIVSMTSFPAAIPYAVKAVKSLLAGSVLPDKLILYLTKSQFEGEELPAELTRLADENPIFEIRNYDQDIRSYRKLIPALRDFPEAVIVTVDDDVIYHRNMLRDLLKWHRRMPETVIAHRTKVVLPDRPYKEWPKSRWYHFLKRRIQPNFMNLQTGVAGVLYPPHSLRDDMLDPALFTELAPTTDDIWFWAACVANGMPSMPVPFGHNRPKGAGKPKAIALKMLNFKGGEDRNAAALRRIFERYPEIRERVVFDADDPRIDLVYLWVDGSDPKWIEKHNQWSNGQTQSTTADCKGRYVNNDELKYSLRSVEKYAPWIRRIFIVTDGQVPEWLDTSNPKIRVVDHKEILPPESLPCFNSRLLEHNLHKIPGLSERFIYANDDMLLNRPVTPGDFFTADGLPVMRMSLHPFKRLQLFWRLKVRRKPLSNYKHTVHQTALLVKRRYGKYWETRSHHNIDAYSKVMHERVNRLYAPEIRPTMVNHLRADNDVQRNIYTYVSILEKMGRKRYVTQRTSFRFHIDNAGKYAKFKRVNPTFFCMNDSEFATDDDRRRAAEFLATLFPGKSEFEK